MTKIMATVDVARPQVAGPEIDLIDQVRAASSRSGLTPGQRESLARDIEAGVFDGTFASEILPADDAPIASLVAGPALSSSSGAFIGGFRPTADLLVDANRDGQITRLDDAFETTWGSGRGDTGALVLPNSDFDGAGSAPDNWRGGRWTTNGPFIPADTDIDANGDLDDLALIRLAKLPTRGTSGLSVTLEIDEVAGAHPYFNQFDAEERVRVFLPTEAGPRGTTVPAVGDVELLGPSQGASAVFTDNPSNGEYDLGLLRFAGGSLLRNANYMDFAIEGLIPGAPVRVTATITDGNQVISSDTVVVQVAPFVLSDHTMNVDTELDARLGNGQDSVSVASSGSSNADLRNKLSSGFTGDLSTANIFDLWIQDGFETGYAQTPTGSMQIILDLPRARSRGGDMSDYLRTQFSGKDVGIDTTINGNISTFDSGGNLDAIPNPDGGPAYFFHGRSMSSFQEDFFRAQGVNPELSVNTDWLWVGHVDEIISVNPDGLGAAYADPELGWALNLWAADINPNATMLQGMNSGSLTTGTLANATNFWNYNKNYVLRSDNLPSVISAVAGAMNADLPMSTPVADSAGTLTKGGSFVAFLDGVREYEVTFTSNTQYDLRYRDADGTWTDAGSGNKNNDEVFPDASAYLLEHWWSGSTSAGDVFTYTANPNAGMVPMPVLFYGSSGASGFAYAYTNNHVNLLSGKTPDGTATAYTGFSYGPQVNYRGQGNESLFDNYVADSLTDAGYDNTVFADARVYHNGIGSIHCGTNVIREVPDEMFWA